jgi:hypothetical protein
MKMFLIGAAGFAMMLAGPAFAATDGQPGATSTGSFSVTLTVSPPGGPEYVQILGLDNEQFDLGTIQASQNSSTTWTVPDLFFCLKRSTPGAVRVTVSQAGTNPQEPFRLQSATNPAIPTNVPGYSDYLGLSFYLHSADNADTDYLSNGVATDQVDSAPGCDANSGLGVAHRLSIQPSDIPAFASFPRQGLYSGLFTVTVSLP